jgi:hypothetical protein
MNKSLTQKKNRKEEQGNNRKKTKGHTSRCVESQGRSTSDEKRRWLGVLILFALEGFVEEGDEFLDV